MSALNTVEVLPGQFMVTTRPTLLTTVLGSCVSVCLWDRESAVAGMNHYLLPGNTDDDAGNADRGLTATPLLIRAMLSRNACIDNLQAKVFGGCNSLYRNDDVFRVGERNIEVAFQVLDELNIPVMAHDVGGCYGRKIVFNTATGKVRMRLLTKSPKELNEEINKGLGYR